MPLDMSEKKIFIEIDDLVSQKNVFHTEKEKIRKELESLQNLWQAITDISAWDEAILCKESFLKIDKYISDLLKDIDVLVQSMSYAEESYKRCMDSAQESIQAML